MRTKIKIIREQGSKLLGQEVTIKGWVRHVRAQKNLAFVEVNDGSTLSNFQVVVEGAVPQESVDRGVRRHHWHYRCRSGERQQLEMLPKMSLSLAHAIPSRTPCRKSVTLLNFCAR